MFVTRFREDIAGWSHSSDHWNLDFLFSSSVMGAAKLAHNDGWSVQDNLISAVLASS